MPSPTLTTIEAVARTYSGDNDSTSANYSFAQATVWQIVNRFYIRHKLTVDNRPQLVTSTTSGLTLADTVMVVTTTPVNIRRFINLWYVTTAGATAPGVGFTEPLERVSEDEILEWTNDVPYVDTITGGIIFPKRWSAVRVGTATASSVGKWRVRIHPTPNITQYYLTEAEIEPTALAAGSDIPDLQDDEGYGLAALTGAFMALRMGRAWLVEPALAEVPQSMAALAESIRKQMQPARPGQADRP